jgi:hypothetical protein
LTPLSFSGKPLTTEATDEAASVAVETSAVAIKEKKLVEDN